jgi:hypothetical protein
MDMSAVILVNPIHITFVFKSRINSSAVLGTKFVKLRFQDLAVVSMKGYCAI